MIPYALMKCVLTTKDRESLALRVLELSDQFFTVRVCQGDLCILRQAAALRLSFFQYTSDAFQSVECTDFSLTEAEEAEFWNVFRITPHSEAFRRCAAAFSADYLHYIRLKLSVDDAALSETLTGYPAPAELHFCSDYASQCSAWMSALHPDSDWSAAVQSAAEIALWLDRPALWDSFLAVPFWNFFQQYTASLQLSGHPFSGLSPDTVYFGNQYCALLMPEPSILVKLLQKSEREHLHAVIVLPPVQEAAFTGVSELLHVLADNTEHPTEVIVNDWGTLLYLKDHYPDTFRLTAGSMLFRSARDPRLSWHPALNSVKSSGISDEFAAALQEDYGIFSISAELAFLPENFTSMKRCLQLPFYQTNTSSYCPLSAFCRTGQRGNQSSSNSCPRFCRDYVFLYPSFLNMVGIGNSLFGFSGEAMVSGALIRKALRTGIDRIVFLFP